MKSENDYIMLTVPMNISAKIQAEADRRKLDYGQYLITLGLRDIARRKKRSARKNAA